MTDAPLIDEELEAFLQSGASLHAASRGATNAPCLMRALGCRVSPDRRQVTILLAASQCGTMLADFAQNGAIAFVASLPSTHRTVQLKGTDAKAGAPQPGDEALADRQRAAFRDVLTSMGYDRAMPLALTGGDWSDVVAVTFTPTSAFVQTPGPGAGAALARPR